MRPGNCMNIQTASAQRTSKHSRHLLRTFAEIINSLRSDKMISAHNADFRSCRSSNACADCLKCSHNSSPANIRNRLITGYGLFHTFCIIYNHTISPILQIVNKKRGLPHESSFAHISSEGNLRRRRHLVKTSA